MGFSDYDSGKFPGGHKANINRTCSLFGQYMKKNGSFEDVNFAFNRNFDLNESPPLKTMDFLPMIEKSGQILEAQQNAAKPEPVKAQWTIFYGGQVMVFDDFPADKMDDIMLLATGGKTKNPTCTAASVVPTGPNFVPSPLTNAPIFSSNMLHHDNLSTRLNDLPIARKESLARFLEKRKARIIASAPY